MKSRRYFVLTPVLILLLALTGSLVARAQDVVTVTWWTESGDFLQHVQDTFVKSFNDSHPNIKLELTGQEKLDDVLRTAFQAGEAPDILQTPGASFIAEYTASGQIQAMDSYAEKFGWKDKLLPWAYESGILDDIEFLLETRPD
ncbi:MAG: extracellular solute-binding protein, partial [Chloroflexota bacterium]